MSLIVKNISKKFGDHNILNAISFEVQAQRILLLMGSSGVGKTTLLRIIAGLDKDFSGEVILDDINISHLPAHKRNIAMLFQHAALFPHLNIEKNLTFALKNKYSKAEVQKKLSLIVEQFNLQKLLHRYPHNLSGGENQRIAIARVLLREPKLLLLDEPFSHLDIKQQYELRDKIRQIGEHLSIPIVYVTHDQKEALISGDEIAILLNGEILQQGSPENVYYHPTNEKVASFLGDPPTNLIHGKISNRVFYATKEKSLVFDSCKIENSPQICACIRPQHIHITQNHGIPAVIQKILFCGIGFFICVQIGSMELQVFSSKATWNINSKINITFDTEQITFFSNDFSKNTSRKPLENEPATTTVQ